MVSTSMWIIFIYCLEINLAIKNDITKILGFQMQKKSTFRLSLANYVLCSMFVH
jgi:hypothetical protein